MKDIVILLDTSGSMTGLRKEIAKHVVINIMDTLGEDDFVTVLTFSDETKPLVDCFTDSEGEAELVQATNENIAVFTEHINNIETMEIANFTSALTAAFTLLERYRTKKVSRVHLRGKRKYLNWESLARNNCSLLNIFSKGHTRPLRRAKVGGPN